LRARARVAPSRRANCCSFSRIVPPRRAQILVQLKTAKGETLLWAGTPVIRTRIIALLFALWSVLLIVPLCLLVELIEDTGGWWGIAWAVVSVFVFVPRISQGSRVVFALTDRRAFVSVRTMYCSIETTSLDYSQVSSAHLVVLPDRTGQVILRKKDDDFNNGSVRLYNIKGFRDACHVLREHLPPRVVERAGFRDIFDDDDDDDDARAGLQGEAEPLIRGAGRAQRGRTD
jgi:hypothetical protein